MKRILKQFLFLAAICLGVLAGCKKEEVLVLDNAAPPDSTISTLILENYVNKCYISLLGREPSDLEEAEAVATLTSGNLNAVSKQQMLDVIISRPEYTDKLVEYNSIRLLTTYDTTEIQGQIIIFTIALQDPQNAAFYDFIQEAIDDLNTLLETPADLAAGIIGMQEMHRRLVDNLVYDQINMGSFNFVLSMFNNFLFRDPTVAEQEAGVTMVNDFVAIMMLETGNSKEDFIEIFLSSDDYYEAQVRELFARYLFRAPNSEEQNYHAVRYRDSNDFGRLQKDILSLDEFVGL